MCAEQALRGQRSRWQRPKTRLYRGPNQKKTAGKKQQCGGQLSAAAAVFGVLNGASPGALCQKYGAEKENAATEASAD